MFVSFFFFLNPILVNYTHLLVVRISLHILFVFKSKKKKMLINYRYIFRKKMFFFSLKILYFHILVQYERSGLSIPYQTRVDRSGLKILLDGPLLPSSVKNKTPHPWVNLQIILQNSIVTTRWQ